MKPCLNYLVVIVVKTAKQVMKDASRDLWLSSEEALNYGIIDEIVKSKKG